MFTLVNGGERLPQRATQFSAGFDVYANEDVEIMAGETVTVGLGIALDLDFVVYEIAGVSVHHSGEVLDGGDSNKSNQFMQTHYLELHPRSSLRTKGIGGGVGIIDIDYPDEIKIVLSNPITKVIDFQDGSTDTMGVIEETTMGYKIKRGDKIGQLLLKRHEGYLLPAQYTVNAERIGGFGSTDGN